ncbi:unnamed protein product, partial [Sphenostylis stenocarpa]
RFYKEENKIGGAGQRPDKGGGHHQQQLEAPPEGGGRQITNSSKGPKTVTILQSNTSLGINFVGKNSVGNMGDSEEH